MATLVGAQAQRFRRQVSRPSGLSRANDLASSKEGWHSRAVEKNCGSSIRTYICVHRPGFVMSRMVDGVAHSLVLPRLSIPSPANPLPPRPRCCFFQVLVEGDGVSGRKTALATVNKSFLLPAEGWSPRRCCCRAVGYEIISIRVGFNILRWHVSGGFGQISFIVFSLVGRGSTRTTHARGLCLEQMTRGKCVYNAHPMTLPFWMSLFGERGDAASPRGDAASPLLADRVITRARIGRRLSGR